MKNEYQLLKHENDLRERALSTDSSDTLNHLTKYFKSCYRKPYEVQLVRKDLIGMGLAADQNGTSLSHSIGENKPKYFQELCDSIRSVTFMDLISVDLFWISAIWMFFQLFICVLGGAFFVQTLYPLRCLLYLAGVFCITSLVSKLIPPPYVKNGVSARYVISSVVAFAACVAIAVFMPDFWVAQAPNYAVFLGSAILCAALYGVRLRYFSRLAAQKPWRD